MNYVDTKKVFPAKWRSSCYIVSPDYKRLEKSVETFGFLNPIIIQKNGTIIDGFHRWKIANDNKINKIPVVVVDVDDIDAMLLHIDLNRYRGIVVAKYLSRIIKRILESNKFSYDDLRQRMSMTSEEFDVLADGTLIKMRKIKQHTYSPAWVPIESKNGEDIVIEKPTGHSEQV